VADSISNITCGLLISALLTNAHEGTGNSNLDAFEMLGVDIGETRLAIDAFWNQCVAFIRGLAEHAPEAIHEETVQLFTRADAFYQDCCAL